MRACWCGSAYLTTFGPGYGECIECGTLVSLQGMDPEQLLVSDDDNDFYGKKYWLEHQHVDLGFDDIYARARNDLTERNLHWLKTLQKYCLPPANVLEIGCSHGSFVALLRQAGYDAAGIEMSPWVVDFGKKTFDIPVSVGPIEDLALPECSFDVIALMDVLEHLHDPCSTIAHCLKLLKPEGLLIIQTPQYRAGRHYDALVESNDPFLDQLKSDEHLYLFSEDSVKELFHRLGADYLEFEPAIFAHYDMFLVVSRQPLKSYSPDEGEQSLQRTLQGRLVLAFLDLRDRELELIDDLRKSEKDRAARMQQIETLTMLLRESESDRAARMEQIETLTKSLHESESDRAARMEQIETLTKQLLGSQSSHES